MPFNVEWEVPHLLTTPQGTVPFNVVDPEVGGVYLISPASRSGRDARVARDMVPQGSGDVLHPHYSSGGWMRLVVEFWEGIGESQPACGAVARAMNDKLMKNLNSLIGANPFLAADGRIQWTPTGVLVDRMLFPIRLLEEPTETIDPGNGLTTISFGLLSSRSYAWDAPENDTALPDTLVNDGTDEFLPVMIVNGPTNTFTITNTSIVDADGNPLAIVYDAGRPGAHSILSGHYVEIDFFRNTVYLDGDVANYKPGIDIEASDFFPLVPGNNVITVGGGYTGTGATMKWQPAWAG